MGLREQIAEARQAGYSDDEIESHLTPRLQAQTAEALSSGYSNDEVRSHLADHGLRPEFVNRLAPPSTEAFVTSSITKAPENVRKGLVGLAGDIQSGVAKHVREAAATPIPYLAPAAEAVHGASQAVLRRLGLPEDIADKPRLGVLPNPVAAAAHLIPKSQLDAEAAAAAALVGAGVGGAKAVLTEHFTPLEDMPPVNPEVVVAPYTGGPSWTDMEARMRREQAGQTPAAESEFPQLPPQPPPPPPEPPKAALLPQPTTPPQPSPKMPLDPDFPMFPEQPTPETPNVPAPPRPTMPEPWPPKLRAERGKPGGGRRGPTGPANRSSPSDYGPDPAASYRDRYIAEGVTKPPETLYQKAQNLWTEVVNRMAPVERLGESAQAHGLAEKMKWDTRRYLGVRGIADSKVFWNTSLLRDDGSLEITGESFDKIRQDAGPLDKDLSTYMAAMRDLELGVRTIEGVAKGERSAAQGWMGHDPDHAFAVKEQLERQHGRAINMLAGRVRDWQKRALLDPLLDVGAISRQSYENIRRSNQLYSPYERVLEILDNGQTVNSRTYGSKAPLKTISGSVLKTADPWESILRYNRAITEYVERVRVQQDVVKVVQGSPNLQNLIHKTYKRSGPGVITFPMNGKTTSWQMPQDVANALAGMNSRDSQLLKDIFRFPAAVQRAGITMDPRFSIWRHPTRYQFEAAVVSKYGFTPVWDYAKGLAHAIKRDDLYGEWMASGADAASLVGAEDGASIMSAYKDDPWLNTWAGRSKMDVLKYVADPRNYFKHLQTVSKTLDEAVRLGVYERAKGAGALPLEAGFESRQGPVDVGVHGSGSLARAMNQITAFQNLHVQANVRVWEAFRDRPVETTARHLIWMTAPAVALWNANHENPRWREISTLRKNLLFYVPMPKDPASVDSWKEMMANPSQAENFLPIPKAFLPGILAASGIERFLDYAYDKDPQAIKKWAYTMFEAGTPPFIPTGAKMPLEEYFGKSIHTGRSIVPPSTQGLVPEYQAGPYTSEVARKIGKATTTSPAKWDYGIRSALGSLGEVGVGAADALMRKLGMAPQTATPSFRPRDLVYERPAIGNYSESVSRFYEYRQQLEADKKTSEALAGGSHGIPVNPMLSVFEQAEAQISQFQHDIQALRDAPPAGEHPENVLAQIDELNKAITEIASTVVHEFEHQQRTSPDKPIYKYVEESR